MKALTLILGISIGGLATACGQVVEPPPGPSPTAVPAAAHADPSPQPRRQLVDTAISARTERPATVERDLTQAHYRTTVAQLADGTELSHGRATLELRSDPEQPHATLTVRAYGAQDTLLAALPLDVDTIADARVELRLAGPAVLEHKHGAQALALPAPARVSLERTQERGKRAQFHARLIDSQGSLIADFQTELGIICLVPPDTLGVVPNGHADSPGISLLVNDTDFKSPFCSKFSSLL